MKPPATLALAHERIEELEYVNECLRRDLGQVADRERLGAWGHGLGLTPRQAMIFDLLYARRGIVVTHSAAMLALYQGVDAEPEINIVKVFIHQIRRKLPPKSIETIWGQGFTLTPTGRAAADAVLAPAMAVAA
jgi:DNA-binding response OmpR family regulator